jgi:anti-sigma B factor antagonist
MMPATTSPTLHLIRLSGEFGPIVRCAGELSVATVEALRRELTLLALLGHPVLTLSLSECSSVDVDGLLAILTTYRRLIEQGRRMVLVAREGRVDRLLRLTGIDDIIPLFPTEATAARALRGEAEPLPGPGTWAEARVRALKRWRAIREAVGEAPSLEVLHDLTSMMPLCERAEEISRDYPFPDGARCRFCPLFYALGGRPEDIGCRSMLEPLIEAVRLGRANAARPQIDEVIATLESMPLPEGTR